MNLIIEIAGHACPWRFPGSASFSSWLRTRPWEQAGARLTCLRLGALCGAEVVADAAMREVKSWHRTGRAPQFCYAVSGHSSGGLQTALARALELPASAPEWEFARLLDEAARAQPLIVMLQQDADGKDGRLPDEADGLLDRVRKFSAGTSVTLVVLAAPDSTFGATGSSAHDFRAGEPCTHLFTGAAQSLTLWQTYLHLRIAWESAGSPHAAVEADKWIQRHAEPGFGDDEGVETALNDHASHRAAKTPLDLLNEAWDITNNPPSRLTANQRALGLVAAGLFWKPHTPGPWQPAPWLARHWLNTRDCKRAKILFRSILVCRWLARDLLSACLSLERHQRGSQFARTGSPSNPPGQDAHSAWARLSANSAHYPKGHPFPPADDKDAWDFSGYGEWLSAHPRSPNHCHDLLHLRNALAHGHYVCWSHLNTTAKLADAIA